MEYGFGYIRIRSPHTPRFYLLQGDYRSRFGDCDFGMSRPPIEDALSRMPLTNGNILQFLTMNQGLKGKSNGKETGP